MATAVDAASARVVCALASITDLVRVTNVDSSQCTMDVTPADAMAAGKKFSDHGVHDAQMPFLLDKLARCCPEEAVKNAIREWPPVPSTTTIRAVVNMLEAEILKVNGWDGRCMSANCCQ